MSRTNTRADAISKGAQQGEREFGLREWMAALPSGQHTEKMATFDTKIESMHRLRGSAAKGAAKAARRHGYESVAKAESFYVRDVDGRLLDGEIDRGTGLGSAACGINHPSCHRASKFRTPMVVPEPGGCSSTRRWLPTRRGSAAPPTHLLANTPRIILTKFLPTAPCGVGSDAGRAGQPHPKETALAPGGSRVERGCAAHRQRSQQPASRRLMRN